MAVFGLHATRMTNDFGWELDPSAPTPDQRNCPNWVKWMFKNISHVKTVTDEAGASKEYKKS